MPSSSSLSETRCFIAIFILLRSRGVSSMLRLRLWPFVAMLENTIKAMISRLGGIGFKYRSELACDCEIHVCMCWAHIPPEVLSLSHQILLVSQRGLD